MGLVWDWTGPGSLASGQGCSLNWTGRGSPNSSDQFVFSRFLERHLGMSGDSKLKCSAAPERGTRAPPNCPSQGQAHPLCQATLPCPGPALHSPQIARDCCVFLHPSCPRPWAKCLPGTSYQLGTCWLWGPSCSYCLLSTDCVPRQWWAHWTEGMPDAVVWGEDIKQHQYSWHF